MTSAQRGDGLYEFYSTDQFSVYNRELDKFQHFRTSQLEVPKLVNKEKSKCHSKLVKKVEDTCFARLPVINGIKF